jgi:beta-lactamase superfamily II metal-dependent hydrolase
MAKIFSLEALEARHGDALILHWGTQAAPKTLVIDGGPPGVWDRSLRPRLEELRQERGDGGALLVELLMVSHIDDDHIAGVIELLEELADAWEADEAAPWVIERLWHNAFDDVTGGVAPQSLPAAYVARVNQGRKVRDLARKLQLAVNGISKPLVMTRGGTRPSMKLHGLKLTVLSPHEERIDALRADWKKHPPKKAVPAEFVDDAVYNLSSIVCLAELGKQKMLLTGDARGDDVLAGLPKDALHVDVFKLPHHGSDRNVSTEMFRRITADWYIVSGDGKYGNPEPATLAMIKEARGSDKYTLVFTNMTPAVKKYLAKSKQRSIVRKTKAHGIRVDLGAKP